MESSRPFKCALWTLIAIALGSAVVRADDLRAAPVLTVLVYNFRQVPSPGLKAAEREAERILSRAGVRTVWVDCAVKPDGTIVEPACRRASHSDLVRLAVFSGPKQNIYFDSVSGGALPPSTALIYYDYLPHLPAYAESAENSALVLGCVAAHEIGHLLLGSGQHSIAGIMQAKWGLEQLQLVLRGELVFLKEQGAILQKEVRVRTEFRQRDEISASAQPQPK